MNGESHNEIMRAIGRIEGGIQGINQRLDVVNGRLNKHSDKINELEKFSDQLTGKMTIVAAVVGGGVAVFWEFIKKKLT